LKSYSIRRFSHNGHFNSHRIYKKRKGKKLKTGKNLNPVKKIGGKLELLGEISPQNA
jgi:hypothetical protein